MVEGFITECPKSNSEKLKKVTYYFRAKGGPWPTNLQHRSTKSVVAYVARGSHGIFKDDGMLKPKQRIFSTRGIRLK